MEYEKSGTSSEDVKRYADVAENPSTAAVKGSRNLGDVVGTGFTGGQDMHSEKHSPPIYNEGRKEDSSMMVPDLKPTTENSYGGGLYGADSPSSTSPRRIGHASDFQSAEGLESDMPDKREIHEPPSSGNRATDITGISYLQ